MLGGRGKLPKGRTVDEYLGTEQFGVVDPALDYTKSTHRIEALNYMLDDFQGIPIRFSTMLRPVAKTLLPEHPSRHG